MELRFNLKITNLISTQVSLSRRSFSLHGNLEQSEIERDKERIISTHL